MKTQLTTSLLLALTLPASIALAETPVQTSAPTDVNETPTFATLDRVDGRSHVDLSLGTSFFGGDGPDFNTRFDMHAQFVNPKGIGGYAALPISYLSDDSESETALGNIEVGGIYVIPQGATNIVLRGGLMLPTADDDLAGVLTNAATALGRWTDLVGIVSDTTSLRLSGSAIHRTGNVFLRGDFGLDVPVDKPDGSDFDPLVRLNLGAGIVQGKVAIMGELASLGTTGDVDDDEDRFYHTAAVSVRFQAGTVSPFAALVIPVDMESTFFDVDFVAVAGLQIPISP